MKQRPISVMIFGILNIGFGVFGFISMLVTTLLLSHMPTAGSPMLQQMHDNPQYAAWTKISTPITGVVSLILLAAGIGLLMLQNWARIVSIGYGIYAILACIVGGVVMMSVMKAIMPQNTNGPAGLVALAPLIGAMIGMVFGLVYPILLIIFMTRPKVVAAFGPAQPVA